MIPMPHLYNSELVLGYTLCQDFINVHRCVSTSLKHGFAPFRIRTRHGAPLLFPQRSSSHKLISKQRPNIYLAGKLYGLYNSEP